MIKTKNFPTLLYLFLLQKSMWDPVREYRYISKRDINYKDFAQELPISKQKIGKMMNFLIDSAFLLPQKGFYIFTNKFYSITLPNATMQTFANQGVIFSDYTLKIYYHLLCVYQLKYKHTPFLFSLAELKQEEDESETEIKKQLNLLYIVGLIDYEFSNKLQVNNKNYILTRATRYITAPKGENTKEFSKCANEIKIRQGIH